MATVLFRIRTNNGAFIFPLKNADSCTAADTDSGPDMYFHWVLWSWLVLWWLSILPATEAAMGLSLNRAFIHKNGIIEVVFWMILCKLESFLLVYCTDELTLQAATKDPTKRDHTLKYNSE